MAYEKQTWSCGEVITDEKLNHIEEGIANAGGDCGYECIETRKTLFEGEVTTVEDHGGVFAQIDLEDPKTETLILTIDGVEHTLNRFFIEQANLAFYAESFNSETHRPSFPAISVGSRVVLGTETAGTYSVKIETNVEKIEVSDCFGKARGYYPVTSDTELFNGNITTSEGEAAIYGEFQFDDPETKTITLTLDGVEHVLNRDMAYGTVCYAESIDKSDPENPVISVPNISISSPSEIYTEIAGDHSVVITAPITSTEVTDDFKNAVAQCSTDMMIVRPVNTSDGVVLDATFREIYTAFLNGKRIIYSESYEGVSYLCLYSIFESYETGLIYFCGQEEHYHWESAFDERPKQTSN